jgi:penicillin-binding protein 2
VAPTITLKDTARESQLFRSRALVALVVIVCASMLLLGRMIQLQIIEYDHFSTLSEDNRVKVVPIVPTRGLIYDRNGTVLAENTPTFSLEIQSEAVDDIEKLMAELSEFIDISDQDKVRYKRLKKSSRPFQSVPVRLRLTGAEVARFAVNRHRFPGVDVEAHLSR